MTEISKNDIIEAGIESLGYRGEGVARIERFPVFIKGAIPGERVRALIIAVKKDFAIAKLQEVLIPSPDRVAPPCPYFGKCGGCDLMHLDYGAQLGFKTRAVEDALKKIAHIKTEVNDCVASDKILGCRNKLSLPVRRTKDGVSVGLFAYNSHRIIRIDDCPLQTKRIRELIPAFGRLAEKFAPYDEETGRGELRHFVAREFGGRLSVTFVVTRDLSSRLIKAASEAGIKADELWMNINSEQSNVILGRDTSLLTGDRRDVDIFINGRRMPVSVHPNAFFQVNDGIAEKLYTAVRRCASEGTHNRIIDAYSGGGLMTAMLSDCAGSVIGVEIEPAAVEGADELMKKAGITNVRNILGDCADKLPELMRDSKSDTMIVLDPPRTGCSSEVISAVNDSAASRIVYVSCNPSTLARDLSRLTNYAPVAVTPFDMFPNTCHVETLVLLSKNSDSHINVTVEFGEGEGQISLKEVEKRAEARKPKEKVTYKMIQQYIEENYGFKVHTAYIAEVKRSLGLPMYVAPNAVEELKHPRPHPTERMVAAIKETLAHFDFI